MLLPDWDRDIVPHLEFYAGAHHPDDRRPCAMEWLCEVLGQKEIKNAGSRRTCPDDVSWSCARMVMLINDGYNGTAQARAKMIAPYLPLLVGSLDQPVEEQRRTILDGCTQGVPLGMNHLDALIQMLRLGRHSTGPNVELLIGAANWLRAREEQQRLFKIRMEAEREQRIANIMGLAFATGFAGDGIPMLLGLDTAYKNPDQEPAAQAVDQVTSVLEPV